MIQLPDLELGLQRSAGESYGLALRLADPG